jgi:hypothetical protein
MTSPSVPRRVMLWEKIAPWVAGVGIIVMLIVPLVGYVVIHDTQVGITNNTQSILSVLTCQDKGYNTILGELRAAGGNPGYKFTLPPPCPGPNTPHHAGTP